MKFTKLLACIVALLFAVAAAGCSAQSNEPSETIASSSSAATPVERATSCASVHIPRDGAHPRPEVWTAFDDEATLRDVAESIGAEEVPGALNGLTYQVSSIDQVKLYWNIEDSHAIHSQLPDVTQAVYYITVNRNGLCDEMANDSGSDVDA